jgi:hypothetical protein
MHIEVEYNKHTVSVLPFLIENLNRPLPLLYFLFNILYFIIYSYLYISNPFDFWCETHTILEKMIATYRKVERIKTQVREVSYQFSNQRIYIVYNSRYCTAYKKNETQICCPTANSTLLDNSIVLSTFCIIGQVHCF